MGLVGGWIAGAPDHKLRAANVVATIVLMLLGAGVLGGAAASFQRCGVLRSHRGR
jgi:hypothetical protein